MQLPVADRYVIQLTPEVGADRRWTVQWVSGGTMIASPITAGGGGTLGPVPIGRRQTVPSVHFTYFLIKEWPHERHGFINFGNVVNFQWSLFRSYCFDRSIAMVVNGHKSKAIPWLTADVLYHKLRTYMNCLPRKTTKALRNTESIS